MNTSKILENLHNGVKDQRLKTAIEREQRRVSLLFDRDNRLPSKSRSLAMDYEACTHAFFKDSAYIPRPKINPWQHLQNSWGTDGSINVELRSLSDAEQCEFRQAIEQCGVFAVNSSLAATVGEDGFIFNPYIHRTWLPLKVLAILMQMVYDNTPLYLDPEEEMQVLYRIYVTSIATELSGANVVKDIRNGLDSKPRVAPVNRFYCKQGYKETEDYELLRNRIAKKLDANITSELKTIEFAIKDWSDEEIAARYGMMRMDLLSLQSELKSRVTTARICEDVFDEPLLRFYIYMGLWGTYYSFVAFPQRMKQILKASGLEPSKQLSVDLQFYHMATDPDGFFYIDLSSFDGLHQQSSKLFTALMSYVLSWGRGTDGLIGAKPAEPRFAEDTSVW